jgi:hypothetical protein
VSQLLASWQAEIGHGGNIYMAEISKSRLLLIL